jgi:hypothetical protein
MPEDNQFIRFLEAADFAGTTMFSAVRMALPYVVFMAVIFGTMDLLLDKVMPVKVVKR